MREQGSSLGDVGGGNEVRGVSKMGAHLKCAPAASAHGDSKKARKYRSLGIGTISKGGRF